MSRGKVDSGTRLDSIIMRKNWRDRPIPCRLVTGGNGLVAECGDLLPSRLLVIRGDVVDSDVNDDGMGVPRRWMSFADYNWSTIDQEDGQGWMVT